MNELQDELLALLRQDRSGNNYRKGLLNTFVRQALQFNIPEQAIIDACTDTVYAGKAIYEYVAANGIGCIQEELERITNAYAASGQPRQVIRVISGKADEHIRTMQQALIARKCPVFKRAGRLVYPHWSLQLIAADPDDPDDRDRHVLDVKLELFNLEELTDMVAHHAVIFQQMNKKTGEWYDIDPPEALMRTLLKSRHNALDEIVGVVASPTMRPDGTIITERGFDRKTKLWYQPPPAGEIKLGPIGETKEQAQDALKLLKDLLAECAFADGDKPQSVDRAAALAALITAAVRAAFKSAPMFFFHKPEPGTGGSYLTKIISTLTLGREASPLITTGIKNELPKELAAAAVQAQPILFLNNLTSDLESPMLAQMLTERKADVRPFGKNTETVPVDCGSMTVLANGNNVKVVGELVRRCVSCRLDTKMELPEQKTYRNNPLAMILNDRGKYLTAVFTIVNAFRKSKARPQIIRLNDFEQWSRFVQAPLVWLGEADPLQSQDDLRARDPSRNAVRNRVGALVKHFWREPQFAAKQVYDKTMLKDQTGGWLHAELFEAFSNDDGEPLSPKSIGRLLTNSENRVVKLTQVGNEWVAPKDATVETIDFSIQIAKEDARSSNTFVVMPRPTRPQEVAQAAAEERM